MEKKIVLEIYFGRVTMRTAEKEGRRKRIERRQCLSDWKPQN